MGTTKIQRLVSVRKKLFGVEAALLRELHQELRSLPVKYGFESLDPFIEALHEAAAPRNAHKGNARKPGRKGRSKITDDIRAEVKRLVQHGQTASQIARTLGISQPSVFNIKQALGLTKSRKSKA